VKIYHAIYTTFDPLVYENVCMITSLPTKRIPSDIIVKNMYQSLPTRWRLTGIEITSLSPYVLRKEKNSARGQRTFRLF